LIRNFIYLDSEKLRSLSSQLFEGVTEQIISTQSDAELQTESQKGPVASGKLLGDIFSKESSSSELRFLEDHAYTLFEARLLEMDLLTIFDKRSSLDHIEKSFVKVTAKFQLNDLVTSASIMKDFNKIGEALWRVTNEKMEVSSTIKIHSDGEARKKAAENGLQMNQKVTDAAATLLHFGYQDLIEANFTIIDGMFSAPLKRKFLRESESLIVHKYSRNTQGEFTMVGVVTQQGSIQNDPENLQDVKDADSMKHAMRVLSDHLRVVENTFSAALTHEVIVDPIAIYSVL
jgi:hypothetical protein